MGMDISGNRGKTADVCPIAYLRSLILARAAFDLAKDLFGFQTFLYSLACSDQQGNTRKKSWYPLVGIHTEA